MTFWEVRWLSDAELRRRFGSLQSWLYGIAPRPADMSRDAVAAELVLVKAEMALRFRSK